jgi:Domain of Unknown Function with PDB structure (DUF3857)/Transglutaminase-like superfamily
MNTPLPRNRLFRRALVLLGLACAILPGASASSQPDWLKQVLSAPAPENKKNADVMLLDYEQDTYLPHGKVHKLVRGAVKILAEAGRADIETRALTNYWYNADIDRVSKAHAWIVSADGKHTKSHSKSEFLDTCALLSQHMWTDQRVISYVSSNDLEIGGVIAWEYEIDAESGIVSSDWPFQHRLPVVKSVFEVIPCPGGTLVSHVSSSRIPEATADAVSGGLKWEMSDIPGQKGQQPHGFIYQPMYVSVRCVSDDSAGGRVKTWTDFAGLASDIIEPRIPASPDVAEKAASLVKGENNRWDRIRAVAEFVQKEITYLSLSLDKDSMAGYRPHAPDEVMQSRLGDCKDKATLMVSMLRSIDEKAWVVLLYAGNPRIVNQDWPALWFNHAIVAVAADEAVPAHWPQIDGGALGKLVLFDATEEDTPLGVLPEGDQGGFGLVVAKDGPGLVKFPLDLPENKKITQHINGTISAEGDLQADVEEALTGSAAGETHTVISKLGDKKFYEYVVQVVFHNAMPLVKDLTCKESWNEANAHCGLTIHFTAPQYARFLEKDLMLMCPRLLNNYVDFPMWKTKNEGFAWLTSQCIDEEVRLRLPTGFAPENLPSEWHQELPNATDSVQYRMDGLDLIYECKLEQKGGAYNKDDYDSLRVFYQKLSEAERRPIVLRRLTKTAKSE